MNCEKCGEEMREQNVAVGFSKNSRESPSSKKIYTCMNEKCPKFNYPQKIEGLTL